jgi:erythronate-4-phosphate dehydrogenase
MVYLPGETIAREDLKDADGLIIRTRTQCDRALLEGTPVSFIATATIGHDHIDTRFCESNGISWHNAAGCNAWAVFQYIAAALLNLSGTEDLPLAGKTLAVIGAGHIGSKVVALGKTLGMNVLVNDPPRQRKEGGQNFTSLSHIAEVADIITLHVPLNPDGPDKTFHLIDGGYLSSLKRKPFIINTSRGEVICSRSLKEHIIDRSIRGCVLDVWEGEPDIDLEMMNLTAIATPHIAGYSVQGKANGTASCVRNASKFFGFGIDDWSPGHLPAPGLGSITLRTTERSIEALLRSAIKASYDIMNDDAKIRHQPGHFERIRNKYPDRHEFPSFTIHLQPNHPEAEASLKAMGFNVEC